MVIAGELFLFFVFIVVFIVLLLVLFVLVKLSDSVAAFLGISFSLKSPSTVMQLSVNCCCFWASAASKIADQSVWSKEFVLALAASASLVSAGVLDSFRGLLSGLLSGFQQHGTVAVGFFCQKSPLERVSNFFQYLRVSGFRRNVIYV